MGIGTTPMEIGGTQIRIGDMPMGIGLPPIEVGTAPIRMGDMPMGIGRPPMRIGEEPIETGKAPIGIGEMPMGIGEATIRIGEAPISIGVAPVEIGVALPEAACVRTIGGTTECSGPTSLPDPREAEVLPAKIRGELTARLGRLRPDQPISLVL
jgi:hypothetical protein